MLTFVWLGAAVILIIGLIFLRMAAGSDRRKNQSGSGFEQAPVDVQRDKARATGRGDD